MMEKIIRRGDIFLIDFFPTRGSQQSGIRPGVIVQCDAVNRAGGNTVLVCPLTTNLSKHFSFTPLLKKSTKHGLKKDSVILCDQLTVIDRSQIIKKLGSFGEERHKIDFALKTILELH